MNPISNVENPDNGHQYSLIHDYSFDYVADPSKSSTNLVHDYSYSSTVIANSNLNMDELEREQIEDENTKTNLNQTTNENQLTSTSNDPERMNESENVPVKLLSPTSLREQNIKILAENLTQIILSNSIQVCREKRFEKNQVHDSNEKLFENLTKKVIDVISDAYNNKNLDEINDFAATFVRNAIKDAHCTVQTDLELENVSAKIVETAIQYVRDQLPNSNNRFDPSIQPLSINRAGRHSFSSSSVANESPNVLTDIEKMHSEMKKDVNSQDKVFSTIPDGDKNQKDRNAFGCVREEMDLNKIAQQEVEKAIQQAIQSIQDQTGMISLKFDTRENMFN